MQLCFIAYLSENINYADEMRRYFKFKKRRDSKNNLYSKLAVDKISLEILRIVRLYRKS